MPETDESIPFWQQHRLSLLLGLTVLIAIVLTSVSVFIYSTSGAAQLDLSRPGYKSVSNKVEKDDTITTIVHRALLIKLQFKSLLHNMMIKQLKLRRSTHLTATPSILKCLNLVHQLTNSFYRP